MKTILLTFIHESEMPIHALVERLHRTRLVRIVRSKRASKVCIGVCITLVGSTMATHPIAMIPHFIWDAIAYTLHGYGAIPVIKIFCEKFNLESLDD